MYIIGLVSRKRWFTRAVRRDGPLHTRRGKRRMTMSDRSFGLSTGSAISRSESGGLLRVDSLSESSSVLPSTLSTNC